MFSRPCTSTLGASLAIAALAAVPQTARAAIADEGIAATAADSASVNSGSSDAQDLVAGAPAAADEPAAMAPPPPAEPEGRGFLSNGGRLLLTGGVSTIEGAGGGGLATWALIGSYSTRDEVGVTAFGTGVFTQDFSLRSYGAAVGLFNRVELSVAHQNFDLRQVGASLGLGSHYLINQTIIGAKIRVIGDAVIDQDRFLPQISVGAQYKINENPLVVGTVLGVKRKSVDFYIAASKLLLADNLLLNATVRLTKANQYGILGFGGLGGQDQAYKPQFEGSLAYLLTRKIALGAEVRTKSNRLEGALGGSTFKEQTAYDAFVAYAPSRNLSFTLAYVNLGQIALRRQSGVYLSAQIGI
ncbi:MAG: DUF3034 family protein [Novosphingobium sp.]